MLVHPDMRMSSFRSHEEYKLALYDWDNKPLTIEKYDAEQRLKEWQKKNRERNTRKMVDFAKGVKVKTVQTKYGEIIKIGVNLDEFATNPITESGYINFDIKTSKSGTKYAEINNFKKDENIPY